MNFYEGSSNPLSSHTSSFDSTCRDPAFSSRTLPSASTSCSPTSTTLSPKAAAISSSVLCLVSLKSCQFGFTYLKARHDRNVSAIAIGAISVMVEVSINSREVKVGQDQEEECACNEDVVVVLSLLSVSTALPGPDVWCLPRQCLRMRLGQLR